MTTRYRIEAIDNWPREDSRPRRYAQFRMTCNAYIPALGRECGRPGVPVRRACVHEHVRDVHICPLHLELVGVNGYCQPCHDADGHHCPITIVELTPEAQQ